MTDEKYVWPYWSVDLPGLSEANSRRLLIWAAHQNVALDGIAVDPADAFSVHMDRETVSALLTSLEIALRSDELPSDQVAVVRGFADQLHDWLSISSATEATD